MALITSTLAQLQNAISLMLSVDPVFNGEQSNNSKPVPIVTEQVGDIIKYTQQAICGDNDSRL